MQRSRLSTSACGSGASIGCAACAAAPGEWLGWVVVGIAGSASRCLYARALAACCVPPFRSQPSHVFCQCTPTVADCAVRSAAVWAAVGREPPPCFRMESVGHVILVACTATKRAGFPLRRLRRMARHGADAAREACGRTRGGKMGLVVRGRASSVPGWPEGVLGALACCWLVNGAHSLRSVLRAMCKNELCQTCEYIDGEL